MEGRTYVRMDVRSVGRKWRHNLTKISGFHAFPNFSYPWCSARLRRGAPLLKNESLNTIPRRARIVFLGVHICKIMLQKGNTKKASDTLKHQPRGLQYLMHAHSHITPAVAAMDSCFVLVRTHQHSGRTAVLSPANSYHMCCVELALKVLLRSKLHVRYETKMRSLWLIRCGCTCFGHWNKVWVPQSENIEPGKVVFFESAIMNLCSSEPAVWVGDVVPGVVVYLSASMSDCSWKAPLGRKQ